VTLVAAVSLAMLAAVPAGAAPATVPAITTPTGGATVAGDVAITATSTAVSVQFYVDGVAIGGLVPVDTGTASTSWSSWGAANGTHLLTAADCDGTGCNASQSPTVSVTLNNGAPTVTTPVNGATTSTSLTLAAAAPGGGIAFFVDSVQVGFDGTSPYSFAVAGPLAEGAHSMSALECDTAETVCNGPSSGSNFTVKLLHPSITSVYPNPFSPNHDGRNDQTGFRVHLPDAENVSLSIQNGSAQTIWGPHVPGASSAGDHVYHWNGRDNGNRVAGDGLYTIVVATTATQGGVMFHGTAHATVRIDDSAPAFSGMSGNGSTFYPVHDGFQDTFQPHVHVGEGGGLTLRIINHTGSVVKRVSHSHPGAGTFSLTWNGRNASNQLVAAGAYRYNFIASDAAGNRRASATGVIHVSHAHLVNKSVTLTRNGNTAAIETTDTDCTQYSFSISSYASGVWLDNVCDQTYDGFQVIGGDFVFTVPGAVRYNSIRVGSVGNTIHAPEPIAAIIYDWSTAQWAPVGASRLGEDDVSLVSNFGTVHGAGRVNGARHVVIDIGVPDTVSPEDYDIATASITVSYAVLGGG
jgi:flagellar hook assembly protein FlgD